MNRVNLPLTSNAETLTTKAGVTSQVSNQLTISRINELMPNQIALEVKGEKFRSLFLLWLGISSLVVELFYASCFLVRRLNPNFYIFSSRFAVPSPVLMIILALVSLMLVWFGMINLRQVVKEVNFYLARKHVGEEVIPQFVITNYKRFLQRLIVFNWVFIPTYVLLASTLGVLIWLQRYHGRAFKMGFWTIGQVPNLYTFIVALAVTMGCLIVFHLLNWGLSKWRRGNIVSYFGAQIIENVQIKDLRKRTNQICFWTFVLVMVILFFIIAVPILLVKRRHKSTRFKLPWRI